MAMFARRFAAFHLTRGDIAILVFFVVQALDAAFTYWGVAAYGRSIEANPLIAHLMHAIGEGPALASAKFTAAACGMILHLTEVHRIVVALTVFYLAAAIGPWMWLLGQ